MKTRISYDWLSQSCGRLQIVIFYWFYPQRGGQPLGFLGTYGGGKVPCRVMLARENNKGARSKIDLTAPNLEPSTGSAGL